MRSCGRVLTATLSALLATAPARGEELRCATAQMRVVGGDAQERQRVCDVVAREAPALAACNAAVPEGLRVDLVAEIEGECLGLYHCGADRLTLVRPTAMAEQRAPDPVFAMVPDADYFDSLLVHELAHAAFDRVQCPFPTCIATAEYAAYALQIRSLPAGIRAAFSAAFDPQREIGPEELNAPYYMMAPSRFAQKAWRHFSRIEDGCGLIGEIMAGETFLDRGLR